MLKTIHRISTLASSTLMMMTGSFSDPQWKKKTMTRLQSCNDDLNITEEYIFLTVLNENDCKDYCDDFDPHDPDYGESHYDDERVTTADEILTTMIITDGLQEAGSRVAPVP